MDLVHQNSWGLNHQRIVGVWLKATDRIQFRTSIGLGAGNRTILDECVSHRLVAVPTIAHVIDLGDGEGQGGRTNFHIVDTQPKVSHSNALLKFNPISKKIYLS